MRFKVKTDIAMCMVVVLYAIYALLSGNLIVVIGGILLLGLWISRKDLYYVIDKKTLVIHRIFNNKEIALKDISAVTEPIPVMYKLNPRSGTISVFNEINREINICPADKIKFTKSIAKLNRKIRMDIKGY